MRFFNFSQSQIISLKFWCSFFSQNLIAFDHECVASLVVRVTSSFFLLVVCIFYAMLLEDGRKQVFIELESYARIEKIIESASDNAIKRISFFFFSIQIFSHLLLSRVLCGCYETFFVSLKNIIRYRHLEA